MQASVDKEFIAEKLRFDPHHFLGLHSLDTSHQIIRLYRPGAPFLYIEVKGEIVEAKKRGEEGLFEYEFSDKEAKTLSFQDYRVYRLDGQLVHDPYAFLPAMGEVDLYLFSKGVHYRLYEVMGGRLCVHQGVAGTKFAVWAPNASSISVVGDFNAWDGRVHPMRLLGTSGVWELFIPGLQENERYKFEIKSKEGKLFLKSDPFALASELRPATASITADLNRFSFTDDNWQKKTLDRKQESFPLNIYELHLGSWKRGENGEILSYREVAPLLASYCKEMGFSHVELLPIMEHPLDESWGYQVTGFFAATSRFGTPEDFQFFVNHLHQEGIGVILDWVPAHFPMDHHSLAQFDGTSLYEHEDPRQGLHPHWNTHIFNYGRKEVANFLIASALFWCDKMRVDGLRVDAVASMLYLDYGREEGNWIPNPYGGHHNLDAIEFLKHLNAIVHEQHPQVLMFAEESTSFTGVSHPLHWGGLGFDLKWNMGWMNDTLGYFHCSVLFRHFHQNDLTFGLIYAFSERFLLPLSHDEVVHGKGSLLSKMPGDDWQKFANLRLLISYQMCQPGKKLLFMGAELGVWDEWNCKESLPWHFLSYERHVMLHRFVKELNHFYHEYSALWKFDFEEKGFEWIDFSDRQNATICYLRKAEKSYLLCVHNFTPHFVPHYFVRLLNVYTIKEVFNTDSEDYYGSGKINSLIEIVSDEEGNRKGIKINLSPLATMIFEVDFVY